jgi:hypothetical protein
MIVNQVEAGAAKGVGLGKRAILYGVTVVGSDEGLECERQRVGMMQTSREE